MVLHSFGGYMQYDNVMVALMDSAQSSDYGPVDLLPMPLAQVAMWDAFDNRPVNMEYVDTASPPGGYSDYAKLVSRAENHVEEWYIYGPGKGEDGTTVWYRCGYDDPVWMVISR